MGIYNRKITRLKNYDYNTPGYYFITVCTKNKQKILCDIVGTGVRRTVHKPYFLNTAILQKAY